MKKCIALVALLLAGCQTETQLVTTKEHVVIVPSAAMYNCPTVRDLPNAENLTDLQVARLLYELNKNNKMCKNSIDSIKRYLEESKKTVEKENTP